MARDLVFSPTIAPDVVTELRALVAALDALAAKDSAAAAAASGSFSSWFQGVIGTDTGSAGLRTVAAGSRSLADAVAGKVQRLQGNTEALDLLREAKASKWTTTNVDVDKLARSLTIGGAVSTVAVRLGAGSGERTGLVAAGVSTRELDEYARRAIERARDVSLTKRHYAARGPRGARPFRVRL